MENVAVDPVARIAEALDGLRLTDKALTGLPEASHPQRVLLRALTVIQLSQGEGRNGVIHAHEEPHFKSLTESWTSQRPTSEAAYGTGSEVREALEFLSFLLSVIKEDAYQHHATIFRDDSGVDSVNDVLESALATIGDLLESISQSERDALKADKLVTQRYNFWKNLVYIGRGDKPAGKNLQLLMACQHLVRNRIGFSANLSEDQRKEAFETWEASKFPKSKRAAVVKYLGRLCVRAAKDSGLMDAIPAAKGFTGTNPYKVFGVIRENSKIRKGEDVTKTMRLMKRYVTPTLLKTVRYLIEYHSNLDRNGILSKTLTQDFPNVWEGYLAVLEEWLLDSKKENEAETLPQTVSSSHGGKGQGRQGNGNRQIKCKFFHGQGYCNRGDNCAFRH